MVGCLHQYDVSSVVKNGADRDRENLSKTGHSHLSKTAAVQVNLIKRDFAGVCACELVRYSAQARDQLLHLLPRKSLVAISLIAFCRAAAEVASWTVSLACRCRRLEWT
jgi:hypothetical protein